MNKQIPKNVKKVVAGTLLTGTVLMNFTPTYAAVKQDYTLARYDASKYRGEGFISYVDEVGSNGNGGFVSSDSAAAADKVGGKSYGLPQFATKPGSADEFVYNWLKENNEEFYNIFKSAGSPAAGTKSFDRCWKKCYKQNPGKFETEQINCVRNGMKWSSDRIQKRCGVDITQTRALREWFQSTYQQFGMGGVVTVCENAKINSDMSPTELIDTLTNYKVKSYKYHFRNSISDVQQAAHARFVRERKIFKQIAKEEEGKSITEIEASTDNSKEFNNIELDNYDTSDEKSVSLKDETTETKSEDKDEVEVKEEKTEKKETKNEDSEFDDFELSKINDSDANTNKNIELLDQTSEENGDIDYGGYDVKHYGCGIVALSMVDQYYNGSTDLEKMAKKYANNSTSHGSLWTLFEDYSDRNGGDKLKTQTSSWKEVKKALKNGNIVVCSQGPGKFTKRGHYILLTGITEDGKILVNDPNGLNYTSITKEEYENGFKQSDIYGTAKQYWIFNKKEESENTNTVDISQYGDNDTNETETKVEDTTTKDETKENENNNIEKDEETKTDNKEENDMSIIDNLFGKENNKSEDKKDETKVEDTTIKDEDKTDEDESKDNTSTPTPVEEDKKDETETEEEQSTEEVKEETPSEDENKVEETKDKEDKSEKKKYDSKILNDLFGDKSEDKKDETETKVEDTQEEESTSIYEEVQKSNSEQLQDKLDNNIFSKVFNK